MIVAPRMLAAGAALLCAAGGWFAWRWAALRTASAELRPAPACAVPVEVVGQGVECRSGSPAMRPGDRIDAAGRVVGRMSRAAMVAYAVPINPNRAGETELTSLPGIGPGLARRIVEDRERNGRFASESDLLRVKGIGEKTLARIRPRLRIEPR